MAGRSSQFVTYGYLISDAIHVGKAVRKHLALIKEHGGTEAELKALDETIAEAKRQVAAQRTGQTPLELTRQDLKDRLGSYRSAARSVVVTFEGVDAQAEKDLNMKGPFPDSDLALANYFDAIEPKLAPYSARLAKRGFSKPDQDGLRASGPKFKAAFAARGLERGEARAATLGREGVFKKLQTQITYFRTLGHEALRKSKAREDFDRVKAPAAKPAAVAAKKARAAEKKAALAAKKAEREAKKKAGQASGT